jgi:hypothetical protein
MPMYEKKVKRITGTATSKPAAKKAVSPAKPSASMAKMNKSAAKPKPKLGGAGNPNYVKDMIKRGKAKAKPGMIK